MITYLTALPDSVVPLTWQLIEEVRVVMEQNIKDVLSTQRLADNTS